MEEKQTLKEFLINNYSNKQLATLYLHNNKKQIDSIYFQVIENILKENNIDITRQLPEDYIVDNYEFINNTNVNMHIIDKSMEIGDINASKIIVTRSLLSLRRMFFNVFSIELYASFIIFFLILTLLKSPRSFKIKDKYLYFKEKELNFWKK